MSRSRVLASVASLVLLGACSGEDEDPAAAGPIVAEDGVVALTGTDRLRWSAETVTAATGDLTIELTCGGAVNHNLVIDGETIAACGRGETATGTVSLEPGDHEFICTVPGHDRTMRGTLTVG